jgi:predicted RNase H-like nuclease (RuvC/YqgF family)
VQSSEDRASLAQANKKVAELTEEVSGLRRRLTNALRQKQFVALERDSCRRLLDSFQDDITSTFTARDQRIADLETVLEQYKQEVERLTTVGPSRIQSINLKKVRWTFKPEIFKRNVAYTLFWYVGNDQIDTYLILIIAREQMHNN